MKSSVFSDHNITPSTQEQLLRHLDITNQHHCILKISYWQLVSRRGAQRCGLRRRGVCLASRLGVREASTTEAAGHLLPSPCVAELAGNINIIERYRGIMNRFCKSRCSTGHQTAGQEIRRIDPVSVSKHSNSTCVKATASEALHYILQLAKHSILTWKQSVVYNNSYSY